VKRRKTTDGKLNLTVRYDGSPTWADGFKLAVKVANQTRLLPDGMINNVLHVFATI